MNGSIRRSGRRAGHGYLHHLEPTLAAIGALGLLMIVRTFLGWTVKLEVEGRLPWQAGKVGREGREQG